MASCEDCIHYLVCECSGGELYESVELLRNDCSTFKNKADVVEVKHGYWIYDYSAGELGVTDAPLCEKCSVCGEYTVDEENFCPNCGAKMDLKEREK